MYQPSTIIVNMSAIAAVVIGRNEGKRLEVCLKSVINKFNRIVYVDSGSTDGSVEYACLLGIEVVEIDMRSPFSASRGRNAGLERLIDSGVKPEFVQFIDGDCELVNDWVDSAVKKILSNDKFAVVFGRRREINPDSTPYNRLIDMEWNKSNGEVEYCGGDALIRVEALRQIGGYNPTLIAGEEPEMCLRMRRKGWKIISIDHEMTQHDAQIERFGQWWKRSVRCGHAYAEGKNMHGKSRDRYRVRQVNSVIGWALILPLLSITLSVVFSKTAISLLSAYILLWYRVRIWRLSMKDNKADASLYALMTVISKFAELQGVGQYYLNRLLGKRKTIYEYKKTR